MLTVNPDRMRKVLTGKFTVRSSPAINTNTCTKSEIRASFENAYDLNESLFTSLKDESVMYKCPDRLRLPLIFYYGHTATVYVNKLLLAGILKKRVNFHYETMFETGVDEMSWDDTENYRMGGSYEWPSVEEVVEYRRQVRATVLDVIETTPLQLPITQQSQWWAVLMGIDHERIHFETSSVLIRQLPVGMVRRPDGLIYAPLTAGGIEENPMIPVEGGDVIFGKPKNYPSYGWDNEYGKAKMRVEDFECSQHLMTNAAFLRFVQAGGYQNTQYWSEEGWEWVQYKKARHPVFWICQKGCKSGCGSDLADYSHCHQTYHIPDLENGTHVTIDRQEPSRDEIRGHCNGYNNGYSRGHADGDTRTFYDHQDKFRYRAMFDVLDLPGDWPVEVNHHEARAYCRWLGQDYRLPTEAEYQCIRGTRNTHAREDRLFDKQASTDLKFVSSHPVNLYPGNESGFTDCHGNVWQWLEDDFNGLPGFRTHYLYDDFSSPQFKGEHSVIVGGSWASTGDEASTFARYAFRRHFIQHAGFRVCWSPQPGPVNLAVRMVDTTELTDKERNFTLDTGKYQFSCVPSTNPWTTEEKPGHEIKVLCRDYNTQSSLAERCYELVTSQNLSLEKMLLVGCETGRLAFDLSKFFREVCAVDQCGSCIALCEHMQTEGAIQVNKLGHVIRRPNDCNANNITFKQLSWLPNELGHHILVIFNNIDSVTNKRAYTARFRELVTAGGLLVVVSKQEINIPEFDMDFQQRFSLHEVFEDGGRTVAVYVRNETS